MNFQEYLISKGWQRYYLDFSVNKKNPPKVYSNSSFVTGYGPNEYHFEHPDHPEVVLWWGLHIHKKPAVFCLDRINIIHEDKYRVDQDLWHDVMTNLDFDTIYHLILTQGTVIIQDGKFIVK